MADPRNSDDRNSDDPTSDDPRVENQDGAVRDVDDPSVQQDTVSGGAPEEPE